MPRICMLHRPSWTPSPESGRCLVLASSLRRHPAGPAVCFPPACTSSHGIQLHAHVPQAAEASLSATLSLLRGVRASLESGQHSGGSRAAAESDLRAAAEQVKALAAELHDVKAVAAAECSRLRRVAEDAEQQRNVVQAEREAAVAAVLAQHTHKVRKSLLQPFTADRQRAAATRMKLLCSNMRWRNPCTFPRCCR